jgi:alpha-1,6-mannosyltransferase
MRIVQVANFVAPTSGGIRSVLDHLGAGYLDAGHDVQRIVPAPQPAVEVTPAGIVHHLRGVPVPASGNYRVLVDRRPLLRLLDDLAPDRLEVSDRFTLSWLGRWGRERAIPVTGIVHERLAATLATWLPAGLGAAALAGVADQRLPAAFDGLVVPSTFAARAFEGAANVQVVPLGVDLAAFHPGRDRDLPPAERPTPGRVRLVLVSRLSREKRPGVAIDAVASLVRRGLDVELLVAGDGPLQTRLVEQARGLPVRFLGFVPRPRLPALIASADVALSPCPIETFGLAALEALACGVPVVAAAGGALSELVTVGAGLVVEPEGISMGAAVLRLVERDRNTQAVAARQRAEEFPWRRTVAAMLAVHGLGAAPEPVGVRP